MSEFYFQLAVVVLILSGFGVAMGYGLRVLLGQTRLLIGLTITAALVPWLLHHLAILRYAEFDLAAETSKDSVVPLVLTISGPGLVLLLAALAVALPRWLRWAAAAVPTGAFLVARYVTLPLAYQVLPGFYGPFDNKRTIWLFIWSVAATCFLLAYCWQSRRDRAIKQNEID